MKKILTTSVLLVFIFNLFLLNKINVVWAQASSTEIEDLLKKAECGTINKQCCGEMVLNNIKINNPFLSGIASNVANPFINYISGILSLQNRLCNEGTPSDLNNPSNCYCLDKKNETLSRLCLSISKSSEKQECLSCVESGSGIWTAMGCFYTDISRLIREKLLGMGVGLAGLIALLCIIYSAFQMQTSQGNPEKIKKTQELLTSCIMGLMLIIFSVFILRLIGVDILKIPGFSK